MNKPPVTDANITKWFNYLAEVIKENGVGMEKTSLDIEAEPEVYPEYGWELPEVHDVAKKDIISLQLFGKSSQPYYKGCNLFDKDHMAVRRCDLDDKGEVIVDYTKIVIGVPHYGADLAISSGVMYAFTFDDDTLFEKAITYNHSGDTYNVVRIFNHINQLRYSGPFKENENCISIVLNPNIGELTNDYKNKIADSFMYGKVTNFSNDYEPYTGGKPSPSFEYPQDVKCIDHIELTIKHGDNYSIQQQLTTALKYPLFNGDILDTQKMTITRNFKMIKINETFIENEYHGPFTSGNGNTNYIAILVNDGGTFNTASKVAYCDSLKYNSTTNFKEENFSVINSNGVQGKSTEFDIMFDKSRGLDTLDKLKEFLKENPITIYYKLATPETVDIPKELANALKSLYLYKPYSCFYFNTQAVLEYYKKK